MYSMWCSNHKKLTKPIWSTLPWAAPFFTHLLASPSGPQVGPSGWLMPASTPHLAFYRANWIHCTWVVNVISWLMFWTGLCQRLLGVPDFVQNSTGNTVCKQWISKLQRKVFLLCLNSTAGRETSAVWSWSHPKFTAFAMGSLAPFLSA